MIKHTFIFIYINICIYISLLCMIQPIKALRNSYNETHTLGTTQWTRDSQSETFVSQVQSFIIGLKDDLCWEISLRIENQVMKLRPARFTTVSMKSNSRGIRNFLAYSILYSVNVDNTHSQSSQLAFYTPWATRICQDNETVHHKQGLMLF